LPLKEEDIIVIVFTGSLSGLAQTDAPQSFDSNSRKIHFEFYSTMSYKCWK